ncbi:MAG TPA: metal-dependent hydrolase [Patescibacteria group bacterium]|nr:metal-dependent hydrolase [Patescibacteria group bacterium]
MTGRTHDLAAFTALMGTIAYTPIPHITLATGIVAFGANMVGGLAPDIDQPTAHFYRNERGGFFAAKLITPLLGGHRYISHSLIGLFIFGFVANEVLKLTSSVLIVNQTVVWWAFMIGFISHLVMDLFTEEGIPLLFPIPIRFGFPPLRALRPKTGGVVEKSFVFPMLLLINVYLFYSHYKVFLHFLKSLS